jgi:hypothetical protein
MELSKLSRLSLPLPRQAKSVVEVACEIHVEQDRSRVQLPQQPNDQ